MRHVTILPMSQAQAQTLSPTEGLCFAPNIWRLATKELTLMGNVFIDIFPQKTFNVRLYNFFSCPVHFSEETVSGHSLQALDRIITAHLRSHLLSSKVGEWTAECLGSSDEKRAQRSDTAPEQARRNVHIGSLEMPYRRK